jgi:hypothetical protein
MSSTGGFGHSFRDGDWKRLRQIVQNLSSNKLGPHADAIFKSLTLDSLNLGLLNLTGTTLPQLTVGYDATHKLTLAVDAAGDVDIGVSGGNIDFGTVNLLTTGTLTAGETSIQPALSGTGKGHLVIHNHAAEIGWYHYNVGTTVHGGSLILMGDDSLQLLTGAGLALDQGFNITTALTTLTMPLSVTGAVTGTSLNLKAATNQIVLDSDGTYTGTITMESLTVSSKTWTFPNTSGTVALTSALASYVPYSGATGDVALGAHTLTATGLISSTTNIVGMSGTSTNSYGVFGDSTNLYGVFGKSTNSSAGRFFVYPAANSTITEVLSLGKGTSHVAYGADGIGGSINWTIYNDAGTSLYSASIAALLTDVSDGAEVSALVFYTKAAISAPAETIRLSSVALVPAINNTVDLGLTGQRWKDLWMQGDATIGGTLTVDAAEIGGTLFLQSGSITDTTGTIDFDSENLTTTGDITGSTLNLPTTSSTVGIININAKRFLHAYGTENIFIGEDCGNFTYLGTGFNVGIGTRVLDHLTYGHSNMCFGWSAGTALTGTDGSADAGSNNILIGRNAGLAMTTGFKNVALGSFALNAVTTTSNNVAIGYGALTLCTGGTNIGIGSSAGVAQSTGSSNTFIGYVAGGQMTTGSGNIMIGYAAGYRQVGATSNLLIIDNQDRGATAGIEAISCLLYGAFSATVASQTLTINANTTIGNATTAQPLTVTGLSTLTGGATIGASGGITMTTNDLTITCAADKTIVLSPVVYEDLRVPLTATKLGGNDPGFAVFKKDSGGTSTGVFIYWFDKAAIEEVFFCCQMPHSWSGAAITPHVHWVPKTNGALNATVEWGLEYTWAAIGGTYGTTSIIYTKTTTSGDATLVADKHYMSNFATITLPTPGVSSMLICRLFRNATDGTDDTYDDDAGVLEIDFHYPIDTIGSRTIAGK